MKTPWSTNVQTPLGIITRPRLLLFTLSAITALLAALLLSGPQIAAADTKPTIGFQSYLTTVGEDSGSGKVNVVIRINPPLQQSASAVIFVAEDSEIENSLAGDTWAEEGGYADAGYAEVNVDFSTPVAVTLPAGKKAVSFNVNILSDQILEGQEIFILNLVEYTGAPFTVGSNDNQSYVRILILDDEAPALPDNLTFTVSKGNMTTPTGPSSKVTIKGDCPQVGSLKVQMKRPNESWAEGPGTGSNVWPGGPPITAIFP